MPHENPLDGISYSRVEGARQCRSAEQQVHENLLPCGFRVGVQVSSETDIALLDPESYLLLVRYDWKGREWDIRVPRS